MTQQEFTALTGVTLPEKEFWAMHDDYVSSPYTKVEYCAWWLTTALRNQCADNGYWVDKEPPLAQIKRYFEAIRDLAGDPSVTRKWLVRSCVDYARRYVEMAKDAYAQFHTKKKPA